MNVISNIKNLNLGADSAEKDIEVGLLRYFYQNDSYNNVMNGKKTIIVGNRGVGKSAIFKFMAANEKKNGSIVLELSPEEYSYDTLTKILKQDREGNWGKQSSYSVAWQYLIYNLAYKALIQDRKGLQRGSIEKIYNYVRDNTKIKDVNPIGVLIGYLKRVEGVKFGSYEAGLKVRELQSLYELEEIKILEPHFKNILNRQRIVVLIDELDKGWDSSEDAKYFIAGLFQAAQKLNLLSNNFKIYISIRQELFDNIPQIYDDAQKIREDIEVIRWDEDELLEFIGLRLKDAIGLEKTEKLSSQEIWNLIFTEVLEYRGVKSFNYMIDRTQLRPREFLQFCKACIREHVSNKSLIDYGDISKAEAEYSEQKAKDLASEYRFQYPAFLNIFETFRGLKYTFEKEELEFHLLRIITDEIKVGEATWVHDLDFSDFKKILWQIGFIKTWVIGGLKSGRKSGSSYLGYYEVQHINLENISRFQIHNAFRAYLNLKEK